MRGRGGEARGRRLSAEAELHAPASEARDSTAVANLSSRILGGRI